MAPLPVEPKDGEHLQWLFGVLSAVVTAIGGLFLGFKKLRAEVREVAGGVVDERIAAHVKEKHDPLSDTLTEIKVGVARIEAHLAERQVALTERIERLEDKTEA